MARGKSNEGRFGIQPVDDVIDAELARPSLQNLRAHLGLSEAFVGEASTLIEKCDEKGRNFLLSDPPRSDLSALGEVRENADMAISKLSLCLAHLIRCRDTAHALVENISTGKAADVEVPAEEMAGSKK